MSSLFVEDQKRAFSDISVLFQLLLLMPVDKPHSVAGFPELQQERRKLRLQFRACHHMLKQDNKLFAIGCSVSLNTGAGLPRYITVVNYNSCFLLLLPFAFIITSLKHKPRCSQHLDFSATGLETSTTHLQ